MLNGKVIIIHLIAGLIKHTSLYKMKYFPQPCIRSKNKIKSDLDLKKATSVDTSDFLNKVDLASLKTTVDKLDKLYVDKLKPASIDLKKLSHAVEKEVVKRIYMMSWLKTLMLLRLLILAI